MDARDVINKDMTIESLKKSKKGKFGSVEWRNKRLKEIRNKIKRKEKLSAADKASMETQKFSFFKGD